MELADRASNDETYETWQDRAASVIDPPANFVREISGIDPIITSYSAPALQYLSTAFDNIGNPLPGVNSSNWSINFNGFYQNITKPQFQFRHNGIGVDFTVRVFGGAGRGELDNLAPTFRPAAPFNSPAAGVKTRWISSSRMAVETTWRKDPRQTVWDALIRVPYSMWLTIDSISVYYKLPLLQDQKLIMTEYDPSAGNLGDNAPDITPVTVTWDNETWLSDALWGTRESDPTLRNYTGLPVELANSTGQVVTLPPNISFVSVIGTRFLQPGYGGECRIVFDPPFDSGWGPTGKSEMPYMSVQTGNPEGVNVSYAMDWRQPVFEMPGTGSPQPKNGTDRVNFVHLLDWQLDPSISYKFAIVNGTRGSANETRPDLPTTCTFDSIQLWKADPIKAENATAATNGTPSTTPATASDGADAASATAASGRKGMSGGAIAGTVVGVVLGLLALGALAIWVIRRRSRRWGHSEDLDEKIQDDTATSTYVAPTRNESTEDVDGIVADSKAPRGPTNGARRQRIVHHEEDAGSLSDDEIDVDILPPVYQEEWNEPGSRNRRRRPTGPRPSRTPSISRRQDITSEEIKYLGPPVATAAPSSGQGHRDFTSEEIKYLGPPAPGSQEASPETSEGESSVSLEPSGLASKDIGHPRPEGSVESASSDEKPGRSPTWQQKGKGVMEGEKSPLP